MIQAKQDLLAALRAAVAELAPEPGPQVPPLDTLEFESPKQAAHGDFAVTVAMQLARGLKKNPRELAQALVAALQRQPAVQQWVSALEIAGPGFINLRLKEAAKQAVVREVLEGAERFGRQPANGRKLMVEFVSANPTGPLHVGHARQGALGDSLSHLFQTQGFDVTREFYYNDAGVQIATLAASTQARIRGLKPGEEGWPESAYNGDYIADIAADFLARKTVKADDREFTASGDPEDLDGIRQFAVAYLRHEQIDPLLRMLESERFHEPAAEEAWQQMMFADPIAHEAKVFELLAARGEIRESDADRLAGEYHGIVMLGYFTGDTDRLARDLTDFYHRVFAGKGDDGK
ncbi:MAG: arginine--tRNA ligase [Aquincola sp.]|nr:arginine--tRNA ligase [Aquincola sp.]